MAGFLDGATKTLELAIYDLRLEAASGAVVLAALDAAQKRGVTVRLMFNLDHAGTIPVPPPPSVDWAFIEQLKSIGVAVQPIHGIPDLMPIGIVDILEVVDVQHQDGQGTVFSF